jgi:hypothetical protein
MINMSYLLLRSASIIARTRPAECLALMQGKRSKAGSWIGARILHKARPKKYRVCRKVMEMAAKTSSKALLFDH